VRQISIKFSGEKHTDIYFLSTKYTYVVVDVAAVPVVGKECTLETPNISQNLQVIPRVF
jgi:hypothetical protein